MPQDGFVVIGKAGKPFGIKGEIRIYPFTETLTVFERSSVLFLDESPHKVLRIRPHKKALICVFEGIESPEQAGELTGCLVKTARDNLPDTADDEYYWFDLIGMKVLAVDGRDLGKISSITPTGANDVIQVDGRYGEVLLPMIESVVLEVDVREQKMVVDPLEGLVPDARHPDPDDISGDI